MEALGLFSLLALFFKSGSTATGKLLTGIAFALSLAAFGLMARTGYLGGQIRHTEIRSGAVATSPAANTNGEHDDD